GPSIVEVTSAVVGVGILRIELDGLAVVCKGTIKFALVLKGIAPVVVGEGIIWVELNCFAIVGNGPIAIALGVVNVAATVVSGCKIRFEADRLLDQGEATVEVTIDDLNKAPVKSGTRWITASRLIEVGYCHLFFPPAVVGTASVKICESHHLLLATFFDDPRTSRGPQIGNAPQLALLPIIRCGGCRQANQCGERRQSRKDAPHA